MYCSYTYGSPDIFQDENEMEQMRLRNLLYDSLTNAAKENLEVVLKELHEEKLNQNERSTCVLKQEPKLSSVPKVKSKLGKKNLSLRAKPLNQSINEGNIEKKVFNDGLDCCKSTNKKHSNIHFLKHIESSLLSSRTHLHCERIKKEIIQFPCAIPLAPPDQRHTSFYDEKIKLATKEVEISSVANSNRRIQLPLKETAPVSKQKGAVRTPNIGFHHIISKSPKSLTVQALPSISIFEKVPEPKSNILIEAIREKDLGCGDKLKKSEPPCVSLDNRTNNGMYQYEVPSSFGDFNQKMQPKRSVSTETSNCFQNPEKGIISKNVLKSLVKEVLEELQTEPSGEQSATSNKGVAHYKEVLFDIPSSSASICLNTGTDNKTLDVEKQYTLSQTEHNYFCEHIRNDNSSTKEIIREVINEYQNFFSSVLDTNRKLHELSRAEDIKMIDMEIQTEMPVSKNDSASHSIEIQASSPVVSGFKNTSTGLNESINVEITKQLSDMSLKIDNLRNSLNNCCSTAGEVLKNPVNSAPREEIRSIVTRDVSLQFSPYLISKSVHTTPTKTVEKANQCDVSKPLHLKVKDSVNIETQTSFDYKEKVTRPTEKTDTFTQYEHLLTAVIDSCTQTGGPIPAVQTSEHSNNTSMSSTPVSENSFLDDILSEGEIPWHLRFLTCHDRNVHTSSNAPDASSTSEEKDYSLSEGEIHPKHLPSWYGIYSPIDPDQSALNIGNSSNTPLQVQTQSKVSNFHFPDVSANHHIHLSPGEIAQTKESSFSTQLSLYDCNGRAEFGNGLKHPSKLSNPQRKDSSSDQSSSETCAFDLLSNQYSASQNYVYKNCDVKGNRPPLANNSMEIPHHPSELSSNPSTSSYYLKPQLPANYSSLSSFEYPSEDIGEVAEEILHSTLKESIHNDT